VRHREVLDESKVVAHLQGALLTSRIEDDYGSTVGENAAHVGGDCRERLRRYLAEVECWVLDNQNTQRSVPVVEPFLERNPPFAFRRVVKAATE